MNRDVCIFMLFFPEGILLELCVVERIFAMGFPIFCVSFCTGSDPLLGRLDYALLSQQALMELVIAGLENVENICGSHEEPRDLCEWGSVIFVEGDALRGEVHRVPWEVKKLVGSLDLQWLPETVVHFNAAVNELTGSIDLEKLPDGLEELFLQYNCFSGTICFHSLPNSLNLLYLNNNKFTGSADLTHLPLGMRHMKLNQNDFSGSLNLTCLPRNIWKLDLSQNQFSGVVELGSLPESMALLDISDNAVSGKATVTKTFATRIKKMRTKIRFKYINE